MKPEYDILIVEDEPVVIKSVDRILSADGITLDACTDTRTALRKIYEQDYRMVISDLMMPGVSGLQFLQELKEIKPDMQVVIISGYATRDSCIESFTLGAFDFIPKPFDIEELLGTVHRCLYYIDIPGNQGFVYETQPRRDDCMAECFYLLGKHAWVCTDEDTAVMGLGSTFSGLYDIRHIEFPPENNMVNQGEFFLRIIDKREYEHRVCAPLSGRIVEHNDRALAELQEGSPATAPWLVRMQPVNLAKELVVLRQT